MMQPSVSIIQSAFFVFVLLLPLVLFSPQLRHVLSLSMVRSLFKTSPMISSEIISLRIYPIKSCRGFQVEKTTLRKRGLDLDRQWMFVDAHTREFLTIRQIPQMTLVNTALSSDGSDLEISITGHENRIRVPARPSNPWLTANTDLLPAKIWGTDTDGYAYGDDVNKHFSSFFGRDVSLVYKGPTPRILAGNGAPDQIGRRESTHFADVLPVQIASQASLHELNSRLAGRGESPITVERFRPNVLIKGTGAPWSEDSWKLVRLIRSDPAHQKALDLDVVARCARCQVPNVDPDTAEKHQHEPWDTLMSYRRVDEGIKFKPCFGMLCVPRDEGEIAVGMRFEVLKETKDHYYIKGF